jgi:hypothetical protein
MPTKSGFTVAVENEPSRVTEALALAGAAATIPMATMMTSSRRVIGMIPTEQHPDQRQQTEDRDQARRESTQSRRRGVWVERVGMEHLLFVCVAPDDACVLTRMIFHLRLPQVK